MSEQSSWAEEIATIRPIVASFRARATEFDSWNPSQRVDFVNGLIRFLLRKLVESSHEELAPDAEIVVENWPSLQEAVVRVFADEFEVSVDDLVRPLEISLA